MPDSFSMAIMKFLFDIFPVLLFFVAFKLWGIYIATAVAIGATICQVAWVWARHGKVDTMLWISLSIILLFGGATLWLHDETFIKWKPTVLYWIFGAVLLVSDLLFRKNLIRAMMATQLALPALVWRNLNLSWAAFFVIMGAANLYVAFHFPTEIWVNFKLFGATGLMLAFIAAQGLVLSRHIEHEDKK